MGTASTIASAPQTAAFRTGTCAVGTADTSKDYAYTYDPIGNRVTYGDARTGATWQYHRNALNQYYQALAQASPQNFAQAYRYDLDGNVSEGYVAGDMNCDGALDTADIDGMVAAVADCDDYYLLYPDCNCLNADINGDGAVDTADIDAFTALVVGYGGGQGVDRLLYTYDAENRLTGVSPATPQPGNARVLYTYDYLGRRVRKVSQVRYTDGTWLPWTDRVFIYDGWRVICEHGTFEGSDVHRRYTWGLDLSRSPEGAGGIGGLLAVQQGYPEPDPMMGGPEPLTMGLMSGYGQVNYIYLYDGHGNVGQLLDLAPTTWNASTVMVARYEYDPYGRVLSQLGTFANPDTNGNPFQFSTKYYDHEVGLILFGHRYYSPRLGRWINRDPIDEPGAILVRQRVGPSVPGNVTSPTMRQRSRTYTFTGRLTDAHTYCAMHNAPLLWADPDGQCPCRCVPEYPPPNPPPNESYDCVGLALRTYTKGKSSDEMLEGFRVGGDCDIECRPCELKCWRWTHDVQLKNRDGSFYPIAPGDPVDKTTARGVGHIVCGQVGADGSAPQCYDKRESWGKLSGPGDCVSYMPPASEPHHEDPAYTWLRSNMTCHAFCGPVSAVPGLRR